METLIPCSVQVLTKNSERTLEHCLETLRPFAEVIVQDGQSTDKTHEIAKKFSNVTWMEQNPAYLDDEGRIRDFSAIRNESIHAAKYDWVLVVDADEGIRPDLTEEVCGIVSRNVPGVYTAFRRFYVGGHKIEYASGYPAIQIRLFHRSLIEGYQKPVHERIKLHPGTTTQLLQSELPVPLPPARELKSKYHRYLMMETKRASNLTFFGWCEWVLFRNLRAIVGLSARIAWIWIIPRRGKRLPLRYEMQFITHSVRTIIHTFPPLTYFRKLQPNIRQFITYLCTGGSATVLNIGSYLILLHTGVQYITASITSEIVGFISAFLLHKYIAFQKRDKIATHFARYCVMGVVNLAATTLILYAFVQYLHVSPDIAKVIAVGTVVLWNYFLYKFLVYV